MGIFENLLQQILKEIAAANDFEIEAMEIAEDHVPIFLGFPSKIPGGHAGD